MKIGIPRALLYFWYGSLWEEYWRACGLEVIVSQTTDDRMIAAGTRAALDEICLPVKIFLGHLYSLAPKVDYLMIPHLIKVEDDAYICPKFMGLPDIVRHTLSELQSKMVAVKVGPRVTEMRAGLDRAALTIGLTSPPKIRNFSGYSPEVTALQGKKHSPGGPTIGILGHPYCIYDGAFNLNLLTMLDQNRMNYVVPEMIPAAYRGFGSGKLTKKLFWTLGKSQFDAVEWMLNVARVDGLIHVSAFACGVEAIIGDLIERRVKQSGKPLLKLNFEEHSGEAGLITRLEAFLDLLNLKVRAC